MYYTKESIEALKQELENGFIEKENPILNKMGINDRISYFDYYAYLHSKEIEVIIGKTEVIGETNIYNLCGLLNGIDKIEGKDYYKVLEILDKELGINKLVDAINLKHNEIKIDGIENIDNKNEDLIVVNNKEAYKFISENYKGANNNNIAINLDLDYFYNNFIKEIKEKKYNGNILIFFDSSDIGQKKATQLSEMLKNIGINSSEFIFSGNNDGTIDYEKDKEAILNAINNDIKKLNEIGEKRNKSTQNYFNEFIKLTSYNIDNYKPISTGINELDKAIDGGLYEQQTIIVGGESSIGKSTMILQMANYIASEIKENDKVIKKGENVFYIALEQSRNELFSKMLSKELYIDLLDRAIENKEVGIEKQALNERQILKGEQWNNNKSNIARTFLNVGKKVHENLERIEIYNPSEEKDFYIETIEREINNFIEKKAEKGKRAIVIIDYLQLLRTEKRGLTDKQMVDNNIADLKRIAREKNLSLIIVSAYNRASYGQEGGFSSFRDSSTIEYSADILLTLNLAILKSEKYNKRIGAKGGEQEQLESEKRRLYKAAMDYTNQYTGLTERELYITIAKNRNGKSHIDIDNIKYITNYSYMDFSKAELGKYKGLRADIPKE